MKKTKIIALIAAVITLLFAFSLTASADETTYGWQNTENGWIYIENDYQYMDGEYWIDEEYYRFDSDGYMVVGWYQDSDYWYYYQPSGAKARDEICCINGTYYGFNWNGEMCVDTYFCYYTEETDEWVYYRAKSGGALYCNEWYCDEYDNWYYYGADCKAKQGYAVINGTPYLFSSSGWMFTSTTTTDDDGYWYKINESGVAYWLKNNTWSYTEGKYYYVKDNELCNNDIYLINGTYYGFNWDGEMYDDSDFGIYDYEAYEWFYYCAKSGGALCCSEWHQDSWGDWYYYGNDCKTVRGYRVINGTPYLFSDNGYMYHDTIATDDDGYWYKVDTEGYAHWLRNGTWSKIENKYYYVSEENELCRYGIYFIDGAYYGFNWNGEMYEDESFYCDGEYYQAKENGVVCCDEWYLDDYGYWYYYTADGTAAYGLLNISGVDYCFYYDGSMRTSTIYDDMLIDKNGNILKTQGWHSSDGEYYYVDSDGYVYYGWLNDGGKYYYMNPEMSYGEYVIDYEDEAGVLYLMDINGGYTALTTDGFYSIRGNYYYIQDGNVLCEDWKKIGNDWFYFDYEGMAVINSSYNIDNNEYFFNKEGKMQTGWILYYGTYLYANPDGSLVSGLQEINGVKYYFDGDYLADEGVYYVNDHYAFVNDNGEYVKAVTPNSWNSFNGEWYYADENGDVLRSDSSYIDDAYYFFDYEGKMQTNTIRWGMYFGTDGAAYQQKGWYRVDGEWIYIQNNYGDLADGLTEIDNVKYYFDDYKMVANKTFVRERIIIACDANGATTTTNLPQGWTYSDGRYYYIKGTNNYYTGWVGDYYIRDGIMTFNDIIYDENSDKYYYIQPNGLCYYNGWKKFKESSYYEGNYVYAKADGSLYYNEWMLSNGNWYYFDDYIMAEYGAYYIDGKDYLFGENGIYLGEVSTSSKKDGWAYEDGNWHFYNAGQKHCDWLYDCGDWYYLSREGMVKDGFIYGGYYFDANGKLYKKSGWSIIKGNWVYFYEGGRAATGFFSDGESTYYAYKDYENDAVVLVTGYKCIEGRLYKFASDGKCLGEVTADGWYSNSGDWYYIKDGKTADGLLTINGTTYYFYNGYMATDEIVYVYDPSAYSDIYYYVNANGALVTKQGWAKSQLGWIYIGVDGEVYRNGTYIINGVLYAFDYDGYML